jgi:Ca2+-binding RTX toxin-like protein
MIFRGNTADQLEGGNGDDSIDGGNGNDYIQGDDGNDVLFGGHGDDFLSGGNGIDQLFGAGGDDMLVFGAQGGTYAGGAGIDILVVTEPDVRFVDFGQNTSGLEMVNMLDGTANSITLNAADLLDFSGTTGETVNGHAIDLVVRGDASGTPEGTDALHLEPAGGVGFTLDASGVALANPAYGDSGTLYDVYSNGTENVAVVQGMVVTT